MKRDQHKLSDTQVRAIRAAPGKLITIAAEHDCSVSMVSAIKLRKRYPEFPQHPAFNESLPIVLGTMSIGM